MTDADDAGLVEAMRAWSPLISSGYEVPAAGQVLLNASDRLEVQRREIEELRRERDIANEAWKGTRCAELREQERAEKAEAALAEALKVIEPFAKAGSIFKPRPSDISDQLIYAPAAGKGYDLCGDHLRAASAFAAKHGGRDG